MPRRRMRMTACSDTDTWKMLCFPHLHTPRPVISGGTARSRLGDAEDLLNKASF